MSKNPVPVWQNRFPVVAPEHFDGLEAAAAVHEFKHKKSRDAAEHAAHDDYRVEQARDSAAHHLLGIRAAHASGNDGAAREHGEAYAAAMKAAGHDPFAPPPPQVMDRVREAMPKVYSFKAHPADVLFASAPPEADPADAHIQNLLGRLNSLRQVAKSEPLSKAYKTDFLTKPAGNMQTSGHGSPALRNPGFLETSHPPTSDEGKAHFEKFIAGTPEMVPPVATKNPGPNGTYKLVGPQLDGVDPKHVFEAGGRRFMVKPHHDRDGRDGYWREATSQAMYHAGGIGHLHQASHVQKDADGLYNTVIHMEPAMTMEDHRWRITPESAGDATTPLDAKQAEQRAQIALMDYLTNNIDRHDANLMIKHANGDLMAIDHGRAFYDGGPVGKDYITQPIHLMFLEPDRHEMGHIPSLEDESRQTGLTSPTSAKNALMWWRKAKPAIDRTFRRHLTALNPLTAEMRLAQYQRRVGHIDSKADQILGGVPKTKNLGKPAKKA